VIDTMASMGIGRQLNVWTNKDIRMTLPEFSQWNMRLTPEVGKR
jgi:glutaredoxin-related protein